MPNATPALVGTIGAVSVGASGAAVTPAWGTSESRVVGHLLVLSVGVTGSATVPTTPSGWSVGVTRAGTSCSVGIFYKVAAGADAAPAVAAITSGIINARLAEYSGTATASVLVSTGVASGTTTSPLKATNAAIDTTSGSLMVSACALLRSAAGTNAAWAETYTNATATSTTNSGTSTASHYGFSYGVTTANTVADADSLAFTTTAVTGEAVALCSFNPLPNPATGTTTGTFTATATGTVSIPAVTLDAIAPSSAGATVAGSLTLSWAHTCAATATTLLVGVAFGPTTGSPVSGYSYTCTYNGVPMSLVAAPLTNNQDIGGAQFIYSLQNPPTGSAYNVVFTATKTTATGTPNSLIGGSISFIGPVGLGTPVTAYGLSTAASVVLPSSISGNMVAAFVCDGTSINTITAPLTSRYVNNFASNSGAGTSAGGTAFSTGSSMTLGWTVGSDWWAIVGVELLGPVGPGASVTGTFAATATATVTLPPAGGVATGTFTAIAVGTSFFPGFTVASESTTTGASPNTSSTFTPLAGSVLVVGLFAFSQAAGTASIADTFGDTGGGAWVPIPNSLLTTPGTFASQWGGWYRLVGTSPHAGAVTVTVSGWAGGDVHVCVDQVSNSNGTLSVPQANAAGASFSATGSVSLPSAPASTSVVWTGAGVGAAGATPVVSTAGFTQLDLLSTGLVTEATAYINGSAPTTTAWSGLNSGQINAVYAVEVAVSGAALSATGSISGSFSASATGTWSSGPSYDVVVAGDNPTHWWKLGDPSGWTTYADSGVGTNTPMNSFGTVTLGQPGIPGSSATAAQFTPGSGATQSGSYYNSPEPFSLECWFQATINGGPGKVISAGYYATAYMVGLGADLSFDYQIGLINGTVNFSAYPQYVTTPSTYNDGNWHHVVVTMDVPGGNNAVVYVDGAPVITTALSFFAFTDVWTVGGSTPYTLLDFAGTIQHVAVYESVVLTPTQVLAHYTAGSAGSPVVPTAGSGGATAAFTATATGSVVFPSTAAMAGSFLASATGTWVPVAHGSGSVSEVFAASATGVVVFSVPAGAVGVFAATAIGTSRLPGTGTVSGTFAASGTGLVTVAATGVLTGTFTASAASTGSGAVLGVFAATSTGVVVMPSHATVAGVFAASAAGGITGAGQANWSFAASAQGIPIDPAFGSLVTTLTALAAGTMTPVYPGIAAIAGVFLGQGTGLVTLSSTGAMAGSLTASATGTWRIPAIGTMAGSFTASATALVTVPSTATALGTFTALGTASIPGLALGTGAIVGTFSASGTGLLTIHPIASLIGAFASSAAGVLIVPLAAGGPLVATFTANATGAAFLPGSSALAGTFVGNANGAINKIGSASSVGSFAAIAIGTANASSLGLAVGSFTAIAAGAVNQLGSGVALGDFLGMAVGRAAENPPMSTLVDDFDSGVIDTTVWLIMDPALTNIVDGQLDLTTGGMYEYGGLQSAGSYDLTESAIFTQLVSAGDQSDTSALDVVPVYVIGSDGSGYGFEVFNGQISIDDPTLGGAMFDYDPDVHKWFRISESDGSHSYDYSTDGMTWTSFVSTPDVADMTSCQVGIFAGFQSDPTSETTVIIDNVNVVPALVTQGSADAIGIFTARALGTLSGITPPSWSYIDQAAAYNYSDEVLAHVPEAVPVDVSYSDTFAMSIPSGVIPGPYTPSDGGGTWVGGPLPILSASGAMAGSFVTRATGALTAVGTAAMTEDFEASGVGTIVLVAEASGSKIGSFSASAIGTAASPGTGETSYAFAALANGAWHLSATGFVLGTFSGAGVPILIPPYTPFSSIVSSFVATSTGLVTAHGAASATGAFAASATGRWSIAATGALAGAFTASATGMITLVSQGRGAVGGTFTATATAVWAAAFTLSVIPGTLRNDYDGWVGMEIVASSPLVVTALGRWVLSGNANNHVVDLCSASGDVIGSVTVNTNGRPPSAFTYAPLSPPVPMAAGATYFLISQEVNGGDYWYGNDTAITTTADAADQFPAYGVPGPGGVLPGGSVPSTTFVPVDFLYQRLTGPVSMSVWDGAEPVGSTTYTDTDIANLGVVFQSSVPGSILGVQFYKAVGVTATHTGALWDANGNLLASGTFTNETGSGWQVLYFTDPVPIVPGVNYTASYNDGDPSIFGFTNGGLTTGLTNGSLTVPNSGGVYAYGDTNTFPNTISTITPNYWVDVLFSITYGTGSIGGSFTATATGNHTP